MFGDGDGRETREEDVGAILSLLYNGIHRFDASRVKSPVFPLEPPLPPPPPPPGPGPEVCCVVFDDNFEF
ncbi:unnamed protein product, partial [Rotaria magnacalcarata]